MTSARNEMTALANDLRDFIDHRSKTLGHGDTAYAEHPLTLAQWRDVERALRAAAPRNDMTALAEIFADVPGKLSIDGMFRLQRALSVEERDAIYAALRAAAPASGEVVSERWYLGSMNDGLFIINRPPRPSTDDAWHDRPDGPSIVLNVTDLPRHKAQAIVDAHNAAPAPTAPVRDGWDEVMRKQFQQAVDALEEIIFYKGGAANALEDEYVMGRVSDAFNEGQDALTRPAIEAERDDISASRVAEIVAEGDGFWRTCTGCHNTIDGYDDGFYPISKTLGCKIGSGCRECGGLGATWDDTDYAAMAEAKSRDVDPAPAAVQSVSDPAPDSERDDDSVMAQIARDIRNGTFPKRGSQND